MTRRDDHLTDADYAVVAQRLQRNVACKLELARRRGRPAIAATVPRDHVRLGLLHFARGAPLWEVEREFDVAVSAQVGLAEHLTEQGDWSLFDLVTWLVPAATIVGRGDDLAEVLARPAEAALDRRRGAPWAIALELVTVLNGYPLRGYPIDRYRLKLPNGAMWLELADLVEPLALRQRGPTAVVLNSLLDGYWRSWVNALAPDAYVGKFNLLSAPIARIFGQTLPLDPTAAEFVPAELQ